MSAPILPEETPLIRGVHRNSDPMSLRDQMVRLDRNERLTPFPDEFVERIRGRLTSDVLTQYPSPDRLSERLGEYVGLPADHVNTFPGSDAAIKSLFHAFVSPGDEVFHLSPSYAMYPVYAGMYGARVKTVDYRQGPSIDFAEILAAITTETKLAFVANPNQPTATRISKEQMERLAGHCRETRTLLVFDEAYYPFSELTGVPLIKDNPFVAVTRSFSKSLGLAGLRLGLLIGHPAVVAAASKVKTLHDVNSMSILVAEELLKNQEMITGYVKEVNEAKGFLERSLRESGLRPIRSHTNFMLVGVEHRLPPGELLDRLKAQGYLLRGPFGHPALRECIRLTVGPLEVMKGFVESLRLVLSED